MQNDHFIRNADWHKPMPLALGEVAEIARKHTWLHTFLSGVAVGIFVAVACVVWLVLA